MAIVFTGNATTTTSALADGDVLVVRAGDYAVSSGVVLTAGNYSAVRMIVDGTAIRSTAVSNGAAVYGNSYSLSCNLVVNQTGFVSADFAVYFQARADVTNHGTIYGLTRGIQLTDGGFVTNTGTISTASGSGENTGVRSDGWLNLTNSGSIFGAMCGIWVAYDDPYSDNTIVNSGVITAQNALILSSGNDYVRNTGTINGDVTLGSGDNEFDNRGGILRGVVYGGTDNDTYWMDDAAVRISDPGGNDTVAASVSYRLWSGIETLVLTGAADINGTGTATNNTINGNAGDNRLTGLNGSDSLFGDAGDDTLVGNRWGDSLDGGDGNDRLVGGIGGDQLYGGEDDDVLIGGTGRDTMDGGAGEDVFVFGKPADTGKTAGSADVILGFEVGQDVIDLSRLDAKSTNNAPNDAFAFIGAGTFTNVAGQVHYRQAGGNTFVEYDLNGDSVADGMIKLNGLMTLTAADFIL